jgi:hypothetical protein
MKIKNIFTKIHLVIKNTLPNFAEIKKRVKMKGSFLHKAAPPPPPPPRKSFPAVEQNSFAA